MKLNNINFIKFINLNFVFEKNPSIAVAVSGGPDSMALLFLLNKWIKLEKGEITALIIDHRLRLNSSNEAQKISKYLNKNKINTKILTVYKRNVKKRSMNEARINRYNLLTNYCKKENILHLFVGHHKDDNLETFFNRKISGSDFEGLQSMKFLTLKNNIKIIRPLLNYSKNNILNYLLINKIIFVEDSYNTNYNYTRPVIRKFLQDTKPQILFEILNEFNIIKNNLDLYNQMISEILLNNITYLDKLKIEFNCKNFVKFDKLIAEKLVKKIYNFFYFYDVIIRSKKVQILIKETKNKKFQSFNLKGLLVKKVNNSLIFSKKTI